MYVNIFTHIAVRTYKPMYVHTLYVTHIAIQQHSVSWLTAHDMSWSQARLTPNIRFTLSLVNNNNFSAHFIITVSSIFLYLLPHRAATPFSVTLRRKTRNHATQCYAILRHAMSCYAVLRHAMPCYAVLRRATIQRLRYRRSSRRLIIPIVSDNDSAAPLIKLEIVSSAYIVCMYNYTCPR